MLKQLFTSRIEDILNKSAPFGEIKSFKRNQQDAKVQGALEELDWLPLQAWKRLNQPLLLANG
jgi:hypothetical protein